MSTFMAAVLVDNLHTCIVDILSSNLACVKGESAGSQPKPLLVGDNLYKVLNLILLISQNGHLAHQVFSWIAQSLFAGLSDIWILHSLMSAEMCSYKMPMERNKTS